MKSLRLRRLLIWGAASVLALLMVGCLASWDSERLWFGAEGFASQFWRDTRWQCGSFCTAAAFFACALTLNSRLAWRTAAASSAPIGLLPDGLSLPRLIPLEDKLGLDRYRRRATVLAIFCLSCAAGLAAANKAPIWFRAHYAPFVGVTDELWEWDLSFFLWKLPAIEGLVSFVNMALWACLLLTIAIYVYEEALETGGRRVTAAPGAARHLGVLLALLLAWKAASFQVNICDIQSGNATYTAEMARFVDQADLEYTLPWLRNLSLIAPCCGLLVGYLFWKRRGRLATGVALSFWVSSSLLTTMIPFWGRSGPVDSSSQQRMLLQFHIKATLAAWGLNNVTVMPKAGLGTPGALRPQVATWPPEAVEYEITRRLNSSASGLSLTQIQLETWVISGRVRPVYVAVCQQDATTPQRGDTSEIKTRPQAGIYLVDANLADINGELLIYAQPGQKVTESLEPLDAPGQRLLRSDFPLLVGERGEEDDDNSPGGENFSPLPTPGKSDRVDDPLPGSVDWRILDDADRIGVPVLGLMRRLPLALHFLSPRLLTSSRKNLFWHRRVADRCRQLVPYLDWGHGEPRLLLGGNAPLWTITGYSWSHRYPNAAPAPGLSGCNYLRATAVATVDGRTGAARFYLLDPKEPFGRLYRDACPELFRPLGAMPAQIRRRLRGPSTLFAAQSEVWASYHEAMGGRVPRFLAPPLRAASGANKSSKESIPDDWELGLYPTYANSAFGRSLGAVRRVILADRSSQSGEQTGSYLIATYSSNEIKNRDDVVNLPLQACAQLLADDSPFNFAQHLRQWRPEQVIDVDPAWGREELVKMKRGRPIGPQPTLITLLPSEGKLLVARGERARDLAPFGVAAPPGSPSNETPPPPPARLNQWTGVFSSTSGGLPEVAGKVNAPRSVSELEQRVLNAARSAFHKGEIAKANGDWEGFGQSQTQLRALLGPAH